MSRAGGTLFVLLLALMVGASGWLKPLDMRLLDAQFRLLRLLAPQPSPTEVVVVGFDEATTEVLREPLTLWHPHLAKFLQAAASGGAAVLGLDVVLPDRSFDGVVPGNDRKLLTGLVMARRSSAVVLALTVDPAGQTRPIHPPFVSAAGPAAVGYALLPLDGDGAVRRFDEHIEVDGKAVPTLAGQMARRLGKVVGAGLIDYASGAPLDFIPLQTVLAWSDSGNEAELRRAFAGKAVLLGSVLKFEDRHPVAVNLVAWDAQARNAPGVVVHAQVLRNLMGRGLVQGAAPWLAVIMSLAVALLWWWVPRPVWAVAGVAAVWMVALVVSTLALHHRLHLPVLGIMLVAGLACGARQALQIAGNLRERRRLRQAFGGYVSPPVMNEILSGALNPVLGGQRVFACVLFSDIRGYTSRSEHISPEQTIAFLNSYFERIVPIIHHHGGTVVSFMGDGIMAVFGVPKKLDNPCASAFAAASAMLADRARLNAELMAGGEPPFQIGIGLHAGVGVAGHIGAASRHEYSVIGDVTNVAARLEGVTKEVGHQMVCSRAVVDHLVGQSGLAALGLRELKGHSPVEIFGWDVVQADSSLAKALP